MQVFYASRVSSSPKDFSGRTCASLKYTASFNSIRSKSSYILSSMIRHRLHHHTLPSCCNAPHCPITLPLHCAPLILRLSPIYSTSSYVPKSNRPCNPDQNTTPIYETYVVSIRAHFQLTSLLSNQTLHHDSTHSTLAA